jgi:hypothetical protein
MSARTCRQPSARPSLRSFHLVCWLGFYSKIYIFWNVPCEASHAQGVEFCGDNPY